MTRNTGRHDGRRQREESAMRRHWAAAVCLSACVGIAPVSAQDASKPAVTLGPPVSLGAPRPANRPSIIRAQNADDGFRVSSWASNLTDAPGADQPLLTRMPQRRRRDIARRLRPAETSRPACSILRRRPGPE